LTTPLIACSVLEAVASQILEAVDTPPDIAAEVARHLIGADAAGHASHGVIHLPRYVEEVEAGLIQPSVRPRVVQETPSSVLLDGDWGFGHYAAMEATKLAVDKARAQGLAAAALVRTGHIGRLGEYATYGAVHGCVTLIFTAPVPGNQILAPGGAEGVLGTNPLAIGYPDGGANPFCLDFATSAISGGKVWLAGQRGEEIPEGVLLAPDLSATTDPNWLGRGALFPSFGGHKGFGLAVAIALLSNSLTGAAANDERPVVAGSLIIAIRDNLFTEANTVADIATRELARIRGSRRATPGDPVILPGDPEVASQAAAAASGVEITAPTREALVAIARRLGVDPGPLAVAE
jgi:LDH2 family malate/lactate/ureidoglycolate dehydrogenase